MKQSISTDDITDKVPPFKIKEDSDNIYILDYIIPKANSKENFKIREQIIWSIYGKWQAKHNAKKRYNVALKSDILIRFEGISETVQKAARNYKYTMAMCAFDEVLQYSVEVKRDKPKAEVENQRRYKEMIIMNLQTNVFKPLDLRTGIHRSYDQRFFLFCCYKDTIDFLITNKFQEKKAFSLFSLHSFKALWASLPSKHEYIVNKTSADAVLFIADGHRQ